MAWRISAVAHQASIHKEVNIVAIQLLDFRPRNKALHPDQGRFLGGLALFARFG